MGGDVVNILGLSIVAGLYPTLLAATATMLLLPNPKRLMFGYLLGAWTTSITVGMVIVFALGGSSEATEAGESTVGPALDFAVGFLFVLGAWALAGGRDQRFQERRRRRARAKEEAETDAVPFAERLLGRGTPRITFVAGLLLSFPGVSYLLALRHISRLDTGDAGMAALVVTFCVIQMTLLEVPLLGYALAPERTRSEVARFRAWLASNARKVVITAMAAVGVLLILRGLLSLL